VFSSSSSVSWRRARNRRRRRQCGVERATCSFGGCAAGGLRRLTVSERRAPLGVWKIGGGDGDPGRVYRGAAASDHKGGRCRWGRAWQGKLARSADCWRGALVARCVTKRPGTCRQVRRVVDDTSLVDGGPPSWTRGRGDTWRSRSGGELVVAGTEHTVYSVSPTNRCVCFEEKSLEMLL
jgi:hypothetical protein